MTIRIGDTVHNAAELTETVMFVLLAIATPPLLGAAAALAPEDLAAGFRVLLWLGTTAIITALVGGIYLFAKTTPTPLYDTDEDAA